jgi:hypothetical protein
MYVRGEGSTVPLYRNGTIVVQYIQGVPKNPKTIEINVLLEFECLTTLLNSHVIKA